MPVDDYDYTNEQKVQIVFHRLTCMHVIPGMTSVDGDGHYGLYL